jgi:hypothetical protein
VAQGFYKLLIIVGEGPLKDLVDLLIFTVKALLNHVGGEFQLAQPDKVLRDLFEDLLVSIFISQLQHILNQIISVWVLYQVVHLLDDIVGELQLLVSSSLLQASLHDTAPMFVHSDFNTVLHASLKDKLRILGCILTAVAIDV